MLFQKTILGSLSLASFTALTACGSTVYSPNATYRTFQNTTDVANSPLQGKAFAYSDAVPPAASIGNVTGTLQHDTGAITLQSPGGSLSDADGVDANGDLVGDANVPGSQTNATLGNVAYTGSYDFVRPFTASFTGPTFGMGAVGFIGMATDTSEMPANGTATFAGEAVGSTRITGEWASEPATVTANFGTGLVDVSTGRTEGGITENIALNGMTLAGNEMSGGTLTVTHNGTAVDATSFGLQTGGTFYGYDTATGGPDEVGVLFSNAGVDTGGTIRILAD